MNKKVLILTTVAILVLLIPSMITISPVNAGATFIEGIGTFDVYRINEGEVWEAGHILQMKNSYWESSVRQQWVKHLSLNLKTGKGTFRVKWLSGPPGWVIEGMAARGRITDWTDISGTYVCHGTGDIWGGWKFIGSFEGEIQYDENDLPIYMKFEETGIVLVPPSAPRQPE